ncbi:MACROPHAGE ERYTHROBLAST ATTACHER-RELATED domain containing protein, putative [Babesia bigemina]|uniref:MACROPHAGE ERYTHROBLAST ATTACHER-RELATED domain containing protein, putative n=1 Tax=Babesia bigemina TaxID=5866 RepID=A0A061D0Q5_BABBI|nr:MACROPHAGE ERYTHROBLAST ATTACHER-RELATED domain containing protein, putative [Babesia bigemina]CDR94381.1 MACROPHAGE ERYTHROBLAST ATTACHER-RELATED domain containing protein, putative [Babesia bigemina]|eukprot:XP_012766567.1 MACROPHAGE ERYTHROBLAST ATTACHER-RELATED domain containing protein, putative [Babesia bigemina]
MGSLLQDAISLEKRRKSLFSDLYAQIDSLKNLVEDAVVALSDTNGVNKTTVESAPTSTDKAAGNGSSEPSASVCNKGRANHGVSAAGAPGKATATAADKDQHDVGFRATLADLSKAVKSLDVYRRGSKITKEFKNQYLKLGKKCFKPGHNGDNQVLPPLDFDDQLVVQMIGMHLLHYGMFDVYEALKAEANERWGANCRAKVSGAVVRAYRILHDMLGKLRNNDINPLIDWVKRQVAGSHLHVDRFNALLLKLYKVQLLGDLYVFRDGEIQHQEFSLTPERISKVKSSGLSQMWNCHNANIGELLTQVLLGENLPSASEFLSLRLDTEKSFVRIFCESGVRIKRSESSAFSHLDSGKRTRRQRQGWDQKYEETSEKKSKALYAGNLSLEEELSQDDYLVRSKLPPEVKQNPVTVSWLGILEARSTSSGTSRNHEQPSRQSKRPTKILTKGWMNRLERGNPPRRSPRVNCSRLQSPSLSQSTDIYLAKMELIGYKTYRKQLYFMETLCAMNGDPETVCRQIIPDQPFRFDTFSLLHHDSDETDNQDDGYASSDDCEPEGDGHSSATAVLMNPGNNSDESFLNVTNVNQLALLAEYPLFLQTGTAQQHSQEFNVASSAEDPQQTLSLTVYTGPPVTSEEMYATQNAANESSTGGIAGRRIRITFPTRPSLVDVLPSHGHRIAFRGLRGNAEEAEPTSPGTGSSSTSRVEGERPTIVREPANINVRGILRMIMRGIAGDTSGSADTVVQLSPSTRTSLPSSGVRNESVATMRQAFATGLHAASRPKQGSFETAYVREDTDEYVRVFLPYESPISVLVCAGYLLHPRLANIVDIPHSNKQVLSELGSWMRTCKQLPIESDLGPAFCFHSCLTCPISKDQTCSLNPPVMLICGHVICSICVESFGNSRRKLEFKCPMCPRVMRPNETKQLFLDWNSCGLDEPAL